MRKSERVLDSARLRTASLSSTPWRPLTDMNQQRRGSYKEENCDTPKVTIESKIFKDIEEKEQHINKI
jgi:hypothetical protein